MLCYRTLALPALVCLHVLFQSGDVHAQYVRVSRSYSYSGTHPLIVRQQAMLLNIEVRRRWAAFRREARNIRRAELRAESKRKHQSYLKAQEARLEQQQQNIEKYADRFNTAEGRILWPSRMKHSYSSSVLTIDRLFHEWCRGDGGVGSQNYRDFQIAVRDILASMAHDLRQHRYADGREYAYLKNMVLALQHVTREPVGQVARRFP